MILAWTGAEVKNVMGKIRGGLGSRCVLKVKPASFADGLDVGEERGEGWIGKILA